MIIRKAKKLLRQLMGAFRWKWFIISDMVDQQRQQGKVVLFRGFVLGRRAYGYVRIVPKNQVARVAAPVFGKGRRR